MTRRKFLPSLAATALLGPMPSGGQTPLQSPESTEKTPSVNKTGGVSVELAPAARRHRAAALTVGIQQQDGNAVLSWNGLPGPYAVMQAASTNGPWSQVGNYTLQSSLTVPLTGDSGFFRIQAEAPIPITVTQSSGYTTIQFTAPDL
jgi:hypothetical protein